MQWNRRLKKYSLDIVANIMTSSLDDFTIWKDKLFWANFATKLSTFQTVNQNLLKDSPSQSLKKNFYGVFGKEMCDQFNSAHYRTHVKALELYIVVEPGSSAAKRNCNIKNGAKIPEIWCLRPAIVDLFCVVEQLNSTAPLHDMYGMIVNSLADLVCDWRYNFIFGDELSTIFYEAQQEVLIELMEKQEQLET